MNKKEHISVCVCTYKRPELLKRLFESLKGQRTENLFTYSVCVVDNDCRRSAEKITDDFKKNNGLKINYHVEPRQNVSLARNKAVEKSKGGFIAFIDDDEYAGEFWLLGLFRACKEFDCDGALGPIIPYFENNPPHWIREFSVFRTRPHKKGELLRWNYTRTSNVLMKKEIFDDKSNYFNAVSFGNTATENIKVFSGEDVEFFNRAIEKGYQFRWSPEAPVYEMVPLKRQNLNWILKKALRDGKSYGKIVVRKSLFVYKILFVFKALILTFAALALSIFAFILFNKRLIAEYTAKILSNIGKIIGALM